MGGNERTQKSIRASIAEKSFLADLRQWATHNNIEVDDLLQEMALRGLEAERCGRYLPEHGEPLAYLLGIGQRVKLEEWRKTRRVGRELPIHAEPVDPGFHPLDSLINAELAQVTMDVLQTLNPEDLDLLRRRYWATHCCDSESLSNTERSRLKRLLTRLRRLFREFEE